MTVDTFTRRSRSLAGAKKLRIKLNEMLQRMRPTADETMLQGCRTQRNMVRPVPYLPPSDVSEVRTLDEHDRINISCAGRKFLQAILTTGRDEESCADMKTAFQKLS